MDINLPMQSAANDIAQQKGVLRASQVKEMGRNGDAEGAAHEMEKVFATMLVGELRKSLPEGLFGAGPGNDTYSGWFDEHLGASLADSGALGLAGQIKASLVAPPSDESQDSH